MNKLTGEGHYIENTSEDEELVWIEIYKADRVKDIPLTQWLALTPSDVVAAVLKIPLEIAENLKKEKQLLIKAPAS
jgi:oxalate decarboxylase